MMWGWATVAVLVTHQPLEFRSVTGGSFMMGTDCSSCHDRIIDDPATALDQGGLTFDEQPAHRVTLPTFSMMTKPVTDTEYAVSGLSGSATDASHLDALSFATWYSRTVKQGCRLPTEAEFEFASGPAGATAGVAIGSEREHVSDWHNVYGDTMLFSPQYSPGGPSTGLNKVVKGGGPRISTRYTQVLDATAAKSAVNATRFRLVCGALPSYSNPPLPQTAVLRTGDAVTAGGGSLDVSVLGPPKEKPHFAVRMVMPVPPDSETDGQASLAGLDPSTMFHSHSPGLEVMSNGDILAVWFSSPQAPDVEPGKESSINARMVQARLRHGSDRWDPPSLFYTSKYENDQSALLWTEGSRTWFWGGGGKNLKVPFKIAVSDDSGGSWAMHMPKVNGPVEPTPLASQPITTAFRGADGDLYFGVDSVGASSGLWKSADGGISWSPTRGRTVGRHTTFFTVKNADTDGEDGRDHRTVSPSTMERGALKIMAYGGKNSDINGYMPRTESVDNGTTFEHPGAATPFPALGGNQRPCVHRLRSGKLVFVGDMQIKGTGKQPPDWTMGTGVYAAISADDGATWKIRALPISLPHEVDRLGFGTLGYSTVREGKNGVIHILSTMTHPCLHYELNEAWLLASDDVAVAANTSTPPSPPPKKVALSGVTASGGKASWNAIVGGEHGYLLDGIFVAHRPDSTLEYRTVHNMGKLVSEERFDPTGALLTKWKHDQGGANRSTFVRFGSPGKIVSRSIWNNKPIARDYALIKSNPAGFRFTGLAADGPACLYNADGTVRSAVEFIDGNITATKAVSCEQYSRSIS